MKKGFPDNIKTIKKKNELLNEYKIERIIGQGTFGKIKLGIHNKTSQKVCSKSFKYNKSL